MKESTAFVTVTGQMSTREFPVKKIGTLIDVDINDIDISVSHRIPSANRENQGLPQLDIPP